VDGVLSATTPEAVGLSTAGLAKIDAALADAVAAGQLPGVSILVARHGKVAHRAVIGVMNLASGEPLAEDTIFSLYSMSKPVTAAR